MKRRTFLSMAAAAAAPYIVPSRAIGQGRTPPASDRISLGLIGSGSRGGDGLLPSFLPLGGCQVTATCDPFRHRRERRAGEINDFYARKFDSTTYTSARSFADYREVISRKDIDAVCIATPDHWHVPIMIAAARAGKDVYVEKPLSPSLAENLLARKVIRETGRIFQYGTQQRGASHVRFGCELVRSGKIGELQSVEILCPSGKPGGNTAPMPVPEGFDYDMWQGPAQTRPYTDDRALRPGHYHIYDYSMGYLGCWGAHPLDVFDWGLPKTLLPLEVEGAGMIPKQGLYDTVMDWKVRFQYQGGVKVNFGVGTDSTEFRGTEGWVRIQRRSFDARPLSLLKDFPGMSSFIEMGLVHAQDFLDAIKKKRQGESDIDSAVRSDLMTQLSDIAVRTGRIIKWDPAAEQIVGDPEATRLLNRPLRAPWGKMS